MDKLKEYIIKKSKELNIDIIGFADCSPFLAEKEDLIKRYNEGRETEFEEKDINLRTNPILTLNSCKSIIAIGISYNLDWNEGAKYKFKGRLSKSTWGIDYHKILKDKMEALIKEIKKVRDFEYKYFVDTGPLIDRAIAKRSGIGYFGKNCSIINDEYGSFIFLGHILSNLELTASVEVEGKCGDCDLCIRACPTAALDKSYELNSKKCISYLTQTKNDIDIDLRDKMGSKIYGCDTCQLVCPKNKSIKKSNHREFVPQITKGYMDLEELLHISNREFKKKYGHMAGSWRGKTIFKRNAIIALGNRGDSEAIGILEKQLEDSNPMIRSYALWAINKIYLTKLSKD